MLPGRSPRIFAGLLTSGLLAMSMTCPAAPQHDIDGYLKSRASVQLFPPESLLRDLAGASAKDLNTDARLNYRAATGGWDFTAAAQGIVLYGDSVAYTRDLGAVAPGYEQLFGRLPGDERRWWDLTRVHEDEDRLAVISRLDRLSAGFTGTATSVRFGRQAISWGNGLVFNPMDIVNPFDPTQVDTEYKAGDDMLYLQHLRDNGNDIEGAVVVRRDPESGDVEGDQGTGALKFHGFFGVSEFDLLVAEHYGEGLLAAGGSHAVGGSVWRGDLVLSDTMDDGVVTQAVLNTSYSWVWGGTNMSGSAEYFYNGFGQDDGCYTPECLAANPALLERVSRRQLFNLGRHYLGGSLLVEVTPLFTVTPNLFWNLSDGSALLQVVTQNSLGDNLVLLGALGVPMGPAGTEYGGIDSGDGETYFASDFNLFIQLGWYF